jgi:predicted lipoprotein with Yx(FWY)xxD motif
MKRLLIPAVLVAGGAAAVIALTAGGTSKANKFAQTGAGPYGGGTAAKQPSTAANSAIDIRSTPLGKILVDSGGRTLYLFEADKPGMSNCSGACLSLWPAFTAQGKPQAHGGVLASKIGTISMSGGKQQVTYAGHPLYYYAADQKPGDTTGQGLNQFGAAWYVLGASGKKVDNG